MGIYVVSRRRVVFEQADAQPNLVIHVPGADQIQVLKDAAGTAVAPPQQTGGAAQVGRGQGPQLSRVFGGQRYLYGYLPSKILDLRQQVKVFLAEDLLDDQWNAFFFVFTPQVVIHGVRERNDDGKLIWRTALLQLPPENPQQALKEALADYTLANPEHRICLSVVNDMGLYRQIQALAEPYGLEVLPFSRLQPPRTLPPLYRHNNYTLVYVLFMLLGGALVGLVVAYWLVVMQQGRSLQQRIDTTREELSRLQTNPHVGHVRQPDVVLAAMGKNEAISPSAVLDAAARYGAEFGELAQVTWASEVAVLANSGIVADETVIPIQVGITNPYELLLVEQQEKSLALQSERGWLRNVYRIGNVGNTMELLLMVNKAPIMEANQTDTANPMEQAAPRLEAAAPETLPSSSMTMATSEAPVAPPTAAGVSQSIVGLESSPTNPLKAPSGSVPFNTATISTTPVVVSATVPHVLPGVTPSQTTPVVISPTQTGGRP